ncbi:hypothetical protein K431DRAFT_266029 [Polychaeton citri CBS 116435]|uniref:PAC domain-containing protein n=1 Tax=Polychaeton citri CBS 116435 TaxID=1314669 RepID=A0A9P4QDB1_9PEZI|nr:hypothetical protein K431DRAFT_266029 [Polychaeton citri CBS 116435]
MSRASPWPLTATSDGKMAYPVSPEEELDQSQLLHFGPGQATTTGYAQPDAQSPQVSALRSATPPSVFDAQDDRQEYQTNPTTQASDEPGSYDLKPPPPSLSQDNVESLAVRFFSQDHLDAIVRDPLTHARFIRFLKQYRPQYISTLNRYVETKKAITAVEYANALAEAVPTSSGHPPYLAAHLDDRFDAKSKRIVEDLVEEALPAYATSRLVSLVTESLVKEITGNNAPVMRQLIPSLAEVYCITDPSLPDNPIVYASEEFYNTTQYGREYVIGRNCRFLQGPKTSTNTVRRLIEALTEGQESCETVLNYRRDGTPFMNLLMIAPLYDNKGAVRYFLGAQIDVSPLIEGGKGLESFSRLLAQDRSDSRFGGGGSDRDARRILEEFGSMLSEEEVGMLVHRASASNRELSDINTSSPQQFRVNPASSTAGRGRRRYIGMDDIDLPPEKSLWPHPSLGPSGRLPGVYQNYLLVRPYPSLRITFTSPALRIPGLLQAKFMDRIAGPAHVREGILDSLQHGVGVTAKVTWLTSRQQGGDYADGKTRWVHCTPLLGSDERVGVWMIVLVENEEVTGRLNRGPPSINQFYASSTYNNNNINDVASVSSPARLGSPLQVGAMSPPSSVRASGGGKDAGRMTGRQLYADYLKREGRDDYQHLQQQQLQQQHQQHQQQGTKGKQVEMRGGRAEADERRGRAGRRPETQGTDGTSESAREQRAVDGQFRDF